MKALTCGRLLYLAASAAWPGLSGSWPGTGGFGTAVGAARGLMRSLFRRA